MSHSIQFSTPSRTLHLPPTRLHPPLSSFSFRQFPLTSTFKHTSLRASSSPSPDSSSSSSLLHSPNGTPAVKSEERSSGIDVDTVTEAELKENGFRSTRRTKLICTIGPATCGFEQLEALAEGGMNVARLNMCHGTRDWHRDVIRSVRRLNEEKGFAVAIMMDTEGSEIHMGDLGGEASAKAEDGEVWTFTVRAFDASRPERTISVSYDGFAEDVRVGDELLVDGGMVRFDVIEKIGPDVKCLCTDPGLLLPRANLTFWRDGSLVRERNAMLPTISSKDWLDIDFGIAEGVDFIAVSFVKSAEVINHLKSYLAARPGGGDIGVIAKIESIDSLTNLEEIILASDGAMVARGDLGAQIPLEQVPAAQQRIVKVCRELNKPVIVASQLLESMIEGGLLYPFWIPGREECGHPDFKLNCNGGFAELNISSVYFRIVEVNYDTSIIRLARSDYIGSLCPKDPLDTPFILPYASNTELLTFYSACKEVCSTSCNLNNASTYIGNFDCEGRYYAEGYYVTRNLSSPLLQGIRDHLYDLITGCSQDIRIPASGPSLNRLQNNNTIDNLKHALEEGFEVRLDQECSRCKDSGGACGYNLITRRFFCYCGDGQCNHTGNSRNKGISFGAKIGSGAGVILFMFLVLALGLRVLRNRKRNPSHYLCQRNLKNLNPLKQYSFAEVKRITRSLAEMVGKGGFGTVYRGTLSDGRMVAVKILKDSQSNGEDFINEVASISQTSHVNIVTLLGFCSEGSKRAIIYEFLENGSLDNFISSNRSSNMDWKVLYEIALGVAHGLEYLHHGCRTRIVHFDIKPQNVLLDHNLCPKVSDFGLAKLCEKKESILSLLDTRGTIGYIAPELFSRMYGGVSHKSDVYSYGMLVLEMIGARNKNRNDQEVGHSTSSMYFPEWIYKDLEMRGSGSLMENEISGEEEEMVRKMTLVGLWCIQSSPSDRPPMNRVVEMMEGSVEALEVPPRPVLQIPAQPFQESSTLSENISVYTEVCSINVA